jgi:hypothetical protein
VTPPQHYSRMKQNIINYSRTAIIHNDDMTFRDVIMQRLLLNTSCPTWLIKQQLLQKRHLSLAKMYLDNPNQSMNAILAALDPHNNILLGTEFILQTQTILAMAYRETLQRIQVEKSLQIDHLKRKMHDTNELPLEIHFEYDDTIIQI